MTQKTIYSQAGWLPYGVTDDSILLQVDMTSEAEMSAISATSSAESTATPEFDSTLGMKCGDSSAGWLITELTGYADLDNEGQISIEVETSLLASWVPSANSVGDDTTQANDPTVLCMRDSGSNFGTVIGANDDVGSGTWKVIWTNFDGAIDTSVPHQYDASILGDEPTGASAPNYLHSFGTSRFSTVNIGWSGSKTWMAINGKLRCVQSYTPHTNYWNRIYIGSYIGNINYAVKNWYLRKLQISNRRPTFPVHPKLARVAFWSDSLFEIVNSYSDTTITESADIIAAGACRQVLQQKGIYAGNLNARVDDGYSMIGAGNNFSDSLSNITALKPTLVVCQMGTNDVTSGDSFNATNFLDTATDGYKAIIDGLDAAGVQNIIVCTIPTTSNDTGGDGTQAIQNATDRANTAIKTLPDYNSKVYVADVFTALGGHSADSDNFQTNDLHLHSKGCYRQGREIGLTILKTLR